MTRRVLYRIQGELALARYRELKARGESGPDLSLRAFRQTHDAARLAYRRLPPWQRWFGRGQF